MTKPVPVLEELIGFQLRLAQLRFFDAFFAAFGATNVTPAEYAVMAMLSERPGTRQGALASALRIKRSNMTKVMRALERRGLIERHPDALDARAFAVHLTEEGAAVTAYMAAGMLAQDRAAAGALNANEQRQLLHLLGRLAAPPAE